MRAGRLWPRPAAATLVAIGWFLATATRDPGRWPSQPRFVAWIGLLLLSFCGWGTLAARLSRTTDVFRGFVRVTLGTAAVLAVAGVLLAAHVLAFPALAAMVVVGAAVQLDDVPRVVARLAARRSAKGALATQDLAALVAAALVLLFAVNRLVGSAKVSLLWTGADDAPAYQAFVRELVQRGSFDQAFSFRRLVAYGGQTVLQAFVSLGVPIRSINVFDEGICPLLLAGMLLQAGRARWLSVAAAFLVAATPTAALNSASTFSGALFCVLLYSTLRFAADGDARRGGALTGLAAMALCTLRHSYIPGAGAIIVSAGLVHLMAREGRSLRQRAQFIGAAALALAVTLAPWSLAALIASHTPLFPLFKGTYRGGGVDLGVDAATWMEGLKGILDAPPPMPHLLVVFMAILALSSRVSRGALGPLALGAIVSTYALAKAAPYNPGDDVRYLAAPWVGLVVAFYCEALAHRHSVGPRDRLLVTAVATVLVALQLGSALSPSLTMLFENDRVLKKWEDWEGEAAARRAILDLQSHTPPGSTILATCDRAYHFDFRRNKIVLVDLPTVASPVPLPGENASPVQYEFATAALVGSGIDYLAFTDPDKSTAMYSAAQWQSFRGDNYRTHEVLVPRFLAWFGMERYLARSRPIVATVGIEKLIRLR